MDQDRSIIYGFKRNRGAFRIALPRSQMNRIVNLRNVSEDTRVDGGWWYGGICAPNKCLYYMPMTARKVLRFDPIDESRTLIGPDLGNGDWDRRWAGGGVLNHKDGNICAVPVGASGILKITPFKNRGEEDKVEVILFDHKILKSPEFKELTFKWSSPVVTKEGIIYAVPAQASKVIKFNPTATCPSDVIKLLDIKFAPGFDKIDKYEKTVGRDGGVGEIINFEQTTLFTGSKLGIGHKWRGSVLGPDEKMIYGVPGTANHMLQINTENDECFVIGNEVTCEEVGCTAGEFKFVGGVLVQEKQTDKFVLYCIPSKSKFVMRFDITDQKIMLLKNYDLGSGHKYDEGVLGADGRIYCAPVDADRILCIDPSSYGDYDLQPATTTSRAEVGAMEVSIMTLMGQEELTLAIKPSDTILTVKEQIQRAQAELAFARNKELMPLVQRRRTVSILDGSEGPLTKVETKIVVDESEKLFTSLLESNARETGETANNMFDRVNRLTEISAVLKECSSDQRAADLRARVMVELASSKQQCKHLRDQARHQDRHKNLHQQRLIFHEKVLDEDSFISNYQIKKGSTLFLCAPLPTPVLFVLTFVQAVAVLALVPLFLLLLQNIAIVVLIFQAPSSEAVLKKWLPSFYQNTDEVEKEIENHQLVVTAARTVFKVGPDLDHLGTFKFNGRLVEASKFDGSSQVFYGMFKFSHKHIIRVVPGSPLENVDVEKMLETGQKYPQHFTSFLAHAVLDAEARNQIASLTLKLDKLIKGSFDRANDHSMFTELLNGIFYERNVYMKLAQRLNIKGKEFLLQLLMKKMETVSEDNLKLGYDIIFQHLYGQTSASNNPAVDYGFLFENKIQAQTWFTKWFLDRLKKDGSKKGIHVVHKLFTEFDGRSMEQQALFMFTVHNALLEGIPLMMNLDQNSKDSIVLTSPVQIFVDKLLKQRGLRVVYFEDGFMRASLLVCWIASSLYIQRGELPNMMLMKISLSINMINGARELRQAFGMYRIGMLSIWAGDIWNLLNIVSCVVVTATLISLITHSEIQGNPGLRVSFALAAMSVWLEVIAFVKTSSILFATFVLAFVQIIRDLVSFLFILGCAMLGFANVFGVLIPDANDDTTHHDGGPFSTPADALLTAYMMMLGSYNRWWFDSNSNTLEAASVFAFSLFMFVVFIVLLNMLIAIVGDSYAFAITKSEKLFKVAKFDLAVELIVIGSVYTGGLIEIVLNKIEMKFRYLGAWIMYSAPTFGTQRSATVSKWQKLVREALQNKRNEIEKWVEYLTHAVKDELSFQDTWPTPHVSIRQKNETHSKEWMGMTLDSEKRTTKIIKEETKNLKMFVQSNTDVVKSELSATGHKIGDVLRQLDFIKSQFKHFGK